MGQWGHHPQLICKIISLEKILGKACSVSKGFISLPPTYHFKKCCYSSEMKNIDLKCPKSMYTLNKKANAATIIDGLMLLNTVYIRIVKLPLIGLNTFESVTGTGGAFLDCWFLRPIKKVYYFKLSIYAKIVADTLGYFYIKFQDSMQNSSHRHEQTS